MVEVTLTIVSPQGAKQIPVGGEPLTFGRTNASSVVIADDSGLSRRHATILHEGGQVRIIDEQSTNGSYLNGALIPPHGATLSDGDEIRIGNYTSIRVSIKQTAAENSSLKSAMGESSSIKNLTGDIGAAQPAQAVAAGPSLVMVLIPALAIVVLVLGAVGFGLYKATSNSKPSDQSANESPSLSGTEETATSTLASQSTPTSGDSVVSTPTPVPSPGSSILSVDFDTPPIEEVSPAPVAQRKLYRSMSEEEQQEFIKQRAQHIAIMMGRRPYAFTPDALVHIKFWLDAFARRVSNHRAGLWGGDTIAILERGKTHAPIIIRAFREHHVPTVVGLYIPFIETEYTNISTNNFAGAAGLFQFLGATAEAYGVPSSERTNVPKMAPAAAKYFRDNIQNFGDDPMSVALSIAGYNRNPESVKRDLRNVLNAKNNEDKERSFWTLIANKGILDEKFQKENVNYVPRFFAAAIFGETPWAFGINDMRPLSTYTQIATPLASPTPDEP